MSKRVISLVVVLLFIIGCLIGYLILHTKASTKKTYSKAPITLVLDWKLAKPIELQIFYTTDQDQNFNEKYSIRKKVTPEDKHIEIVIPEDKIYRFRIDFGSQPEQVVLKNVEIVADQYINFNDWYSYAYMNIEKNKINKKDNSLTVFSTHKDPYMFWSLPFVLYKNE